MVTDVITTGDIYTGVVASDMARISLTHTTPLIKGDEVFFTKKIEFPTRKDDPIFATLVHKDDIVATWEEKYRYSLP
jgi:hypothetical protein